MHAAFVHAHNSPAAPSTTPADRTTGAYPGTTYDPGSTDLPGITHYPAPSITNPEPTIRAYTPPPTTPMPGPPTSAHSSDTHWVLRGPYSSLWTCDQASDEWPERTSVCFEHDGSAYFYGLYPDSQGG